MGGTSHLLPFLGLVLLFQGALIIAEIRLSQHPTTINTNLEGKLCSKHLLLGLFYNNQQKMVEVDLETKNLAINYLMQKIVISGLSPNVENTMHFSLKSKIYSAFLLPD